MSSPQSKAAGLYQHRRALLLAAVAAFGAMTLGYDTGVLLRRSIRAQRARRTDLLLAYSGIGGGVIALPSFVAEMYPADITASGKSNVSSNIVSILFGGAFFGSFFAMPVTRRIGHRYSLQLAAIIFVAGAMCQIAKTDGLPALYTGRAISGFGIGMMSNLSNAFIAETAPRHLRGSLGAFFQFFLVIGGMCAYFATYGASLHMSTTSSNQWRVPLACQAIPGGLLFFGLFFVSDSPRWLAEVGRREKALKSLAYLRGSTETDEAVLLEMAEITGQLDEEAARGEGLSFKEVFQSPNRLRFFSAYAMAFFLIFTGHNSILYYGPSIFATIGYKSSGSLLASGLFGVIKVGCMPIFMLFFVDRFGRRTLLQAGNLLRLVCLCAFAGLTSKPIVAGSTQAQAAAAMLYLFIVFYSFSIGPLAWIYIAEIFPARLRQWGISSSIALTWLANYSVSKITPIAILHIGYRWWIILGVFNVLSAVCIYFIPEPNGLSLEEMDVAFKAVTLAEREANIGKAAEQFGISAAHPIRLTSMSNVSTEDEGKDQVTTSARMV